MKFVKSSTRYIEAFPDICIHRFEITNERLIDPVYTVGSSRIQSYKTFNNKHQVLIQITGNLSHALETKSSLEIVEEIEYADGSFEKKRHAVYYLNCTRKELVRNRMNYHYDAGGYKIMTESYLPGRDTVVKDLAALKMDLKYLKVKQEDIISVIEKTCTEKGGHFPNTNKTSCLACHKRLKETHG